MSKLDSFQVGDRVLYTRNASRKYENDFEGTVVEVLAQSVRVELMNRAGLKTTKCLKPDHLTKVEVANDD